MGYHIRRDGAWLCLRDKKHPRLFLFDALLN